MSSGYKNYIADKGLNDETYTPESVALIRISGTSVHNNIALQVDAVSCYNHFLGLKLLDLPNVLAFIDLTVLILFHKLVIVSGLYLILI